MSEQSVGEVGTAKRIGKIFFRMVFSVPSPRMSYKQRVVRDTQLSHPAGGRSPDLEISAYLSLSGLLRAVCE